MVSSFQKTHPPPQCFQTNLQPPQWSGLPRKFTGDTRPQQQQQTVSELPSFGLLPHALAYANAFARSTVIIDERVWETFRQHYSGNVEIAIQLCIQHWSRTAPRSIKRYVNALIKQLQHRAQLPGFGQPYLYRRMAARNAMRVQRRQARTPTPQEVSLMIRETSGVIRALLILLCITGARFGDIYPSNPEERDRPTWEQTTLAWKFIVQQKGDWECTRFIRFLPLRSLSMVRPMLTNNSVQRLNVSHVMKVLRAHGLTGHSFRHLVATTLSQQGYSRLDITRLTGHTNPLAKWERQIQQYIRPSENSPESKLQMEMASRMMSLLCL